MNKQILFSEKELRQAIKEDFGAKCKEQDPGCIVCDAYYYFERILKQAKLNKKKGFLLKIVSWMKEDLAVKDNKRTFKKKWS